MSNLLGFNLSEPRVSNTAGATENMSADESIAGQHGARRNSIGRHLQQNC